MHERPNQPDTAALTASMSFSAGLSVSLDCFAILFRDSSGAEMANFTFKFKLSLVKLTSTQSQYLLSWVQMGKLGYEHLAH